MSESPLLLAQPSLLRRLPESNRWKTPEGNVSASAPLRYVKHGYAARAVLERAIAARDGNWRCFYCGQSANGLDHVTSRFRGGSDEISNLVFCCQDCNWEKTTTPGWLFALKKTWDAAWPDPFLSRWRGKGIRAVECLQPSIPSKSHGNRLGFLRDDQEHGS